MSLRIGLGDDMVPYDNRLIIGIDVDQEVWLHLNWLVQMTLNIRG